MRYQIAHTTTYHYSQSVPLAPHIVRLRPRCDGCQALSMFSLSVTPKPLQTSPVVDLDGNTVIKLWFDQQQPTNQLQVQVLSQVETYRDNPFDYLLEPWATHLPIDYPTSLRLQLQPYLEGRSLAGIDPTALQLAQEIHHATAGDPTHFLTTLNQRIYESCRYEIRETGEPLAPGVTWKEKSGSCRDYTVLFIEVCRAIGLAARFVSGYQEGDLSNPERHLHAWAEVYLPGAGWRGYDPTHGLAVSDRHIALVASAIPSYAAPISGSINWTGVQSQMTYHLSIQALSAGMTVQSVRM